MNGAPVAKETTRQQQMTAAVDSVAPNPGRMRALMRSNLLYNHYLRALRVQTLTQPLRPS